MMSVVDWFLKNKRDYPWRQNLSPYSVWVSEVMLQQTRAEVVIPYFTKWMIRFPTIESLSLASEEDVLKAWEGLGYYSRVRNLHAGAKQVMKEFNKELPSETEKLLKIKGIGPYTAGAIAAFAFGKRVPFVDGNIARVIARFFAFEKCIDKSPKEIQELVKESLPQEKAPEFMEGLIELGQQICMKRPLCEICPLNDGCKAFKLSETQNFPQKTKREKTVKLERQVAVILFENSILLKKNKKGKVMADLWEFPYVVCDQDRSVLNLMNSFAFDMKLEMILPSISHHFTKYKATLFPYLFETKEKVSVDETMWIEIDKLNDLPFSSGHKRIKDHLLEEYFPRFCRQ